jgi:hypothetical protein
MIVPTGQVLVIVAVDRLAEARRTAGQTNDDRMNAARAELRGEFYSGKLTRVICPRSGKTHTIRPHYWALEEALTWLEQGECWLTEYLVDPPLGMLYGRERVSIFMDEHDLQLLIAKQEVKQEAAPPPGQMSAENARIVPARRGRKPTYDWEDAMNFARLEFEKRGDYSDPQNAVDGWRSQADWVRLVVSYMAKHNGGKEPPESEVKRRLKDLYDTSRK